MTQNVLFESLVNSGLSNNSGLSTTRPSLSPNPNRRERTQIMLHQLVECPHLGCREVHCEIFERTLYLKGVVPSYYLKQVAQELSRSVAAVDRIENQLHVEYTINR